MKWLTCAKCQSRGERHTLGEVIPKGILQGSEIRLEGAHAGLTFSDIYEANKSYCRWVLMTADQGEEIQMIQLIRLAAYNQQREAQEASGDLAMQEETDNDS